MYYYRYAARNQILHENLINQENLAQLIEIVRSFVGNYNMRHSANFDCVLGTIFILCEGSLEKLVYDTV